MVRSIKASNYPPIQNRLVKSTVSFWGNFGRNLRQRSYYLLAIWNILFFQNFVIYIVFSNLESLATRLKSSFFLFLIDSIGNFWYLFSIGIWFFRHQLSFLARNNSFFFFRDTFLPFFFFLISEFLLAFSFFFFFFLYCSNSSPEKVAVISFTILTTTSRILHSRITNVEAFLSLLFHRSGFGITQGKSGIDYFLLSGGGGGGVLFTEVAETRKEGTQVRIEMILEKLIYSNQQLRTISRWIFERRLT